MSSRSGRNAVQRGSAAEGSNLLGFYLLKVTSLRGLFMRRAAFRVFRSVSRVFMPIAANVAVCGLALGFTPVSVRVGPGYTDVSPHQLVRTSGNVLYVVSPNGTSYKSNTTATLIVSKGNLAGVPTAYVAQDVAHSPGTPTTGITLRAGVASSASAIDGSDVIHSVWIDNHGEYDRRIRERVLCAVFHQDRQMGSSNFARWRYRMDRLRGG